MAWRDLDAGASIRLSVNGELRQDDRLGAMSLNVAELLAALSRYFALRPGDIVFTGTPAGVGPLARGDLVDARIDGIGELRFTVG